MGLESVLSMHLSMEPEGESIHEFCGHIDNHVGSVPSLESKFLLIITIFERIHDNQLFFRVHRRRFTPKSTHRSPHSRCYGLGNMYVFGPVRPATSREYSTLIHKVHIVDESMTCTRPSTYQMLVIFYPVCAKLRITSLRILCQVERPSSSWDFHPMFGRTPSQCDTLPPYPSSRSGDDHVYEYRSTSTYVSHSRCIQFPR